MCTPSRSSFLSGRLPVHVETALPNPEDPNQGVPRNMTSIAAKLKAQGYATHVVGKCAWLRVERGRPCHVVCHVVTLAHEGALCVAPRGCRHCAVGGRKGVLLYPRPTRPSSATGDLGMATPDHTPHGRSFDSSLIYFEHKIDYWDHTLAQSSCTKYSSSIRDLWSHDGAADPGAPAVGIDNGTYVEYAFRDRVLDIVAKHDMSAGPLYLQYDPHVAHCPLQVPSDWLAKFNFPDDEKACQAQTASIYPGSVHADYRCRNQYEAMVALLDEVLGNVTAAIKARGWWDETLMVLFSDNGGPIDVQESGSNNWPLR